MKPGIRVLRGPDWRYGNQDGGLGYLGTVIKVSRNNTVRVRWDVGSETECRAGADGAFDLRIYDNAQVGEKQVICDGYCLSESDNIIYGFRWKCLVCNDSDCCTPCYMRDAAELDHPYVRYTTARATVVRVPPRKRSRKVPLNGIFPGAEVKKAAQTGDSEERLGKVVEIINLQPDAYRSAVKVEWYGQKTRKDDEGNPDLPIYRLGADGKVELTLVNPMSPGHVYIEHLPLLDLTMPVDVIFNPGDTVRVDVNLDTFKALQTEYGGWVDDLEKCLGLEGQIEVIKDSNRRVVSVKYDDFTCGAIYLNVLTKLSTITAGDTVRIIEDMQRVKKCQMGHGGWQDSLVSILGATGTVKRIDDSGSALVQVKDQVFVFSQACLVKTAAAGSGTTNKEGNLPYSTAPVPVRSMSIRSKLAMKLSRFRADQPVNVGVRVVRGPDWTFDNQDGGEGSLGSVVDICGVRDNDIYPQQCVVVQWDNGEKNVYRAGYEKAHDLRLLDNAGIGVKHNATCNECNVSDIPGLLWRCCECSNVALCSDCYSNDKHDLNHQFLRIDCVGDSGTKVPKRAMSRKMHLKGVFEKARVTRGPDWRWTNQDGGNGKLGDVIAIVNFSPDTDHDAAEVTWENGYTNVYRLGYKGRHDIKCVHPAPGGSYYKDHIPLLRLDVSPVKAEKEQAEKTASTLAAEQGARFREGDRVRIEIDVDLLKMMEESRGAWNDHMVECIGKTGTVIVSKGQDITVNFEEAGSWGFSEASLCKVKEFVPGEIVKVNDSLDHVRMLQTDRGGWNDMMAKVIGLRGRVEEIDEDGDVQVSFGEYTWTFNPDCLMPDRGDPDNVQYSPDSAEVPATPEPAPPTPKPEPTGDEQLDRLFAAITDGDTSRVRTILQREPQLMLLTMKGKSAMHLATHCGKLEIVKLLLDTAGKDNLLEMLDDEGSTPLLTAIKGGQVETIRFLVEQGANTDARNQSRQTAAHMAVASRNIPVLTLLRELRFHINSQDMLKQTAIFDAITTGDKEVVKVTLDWPGLEVSYTDSIGFSPFCCACRKGDMYAVQKILELAPGQLNEPKPDGYTGLHLAVLNGNLALVQLLLQQPNIELERKTSHEGRTPLHLACMEALPEIVRLLLSAGAEKMAVDQSGKSCLHLCVQPQPEKPKEGKDQSLFDLVHLLISEGVPLEGRDRSGDTPLNLARGATKDLLQDILQQRAGDRPNPMATSLQGQGQGHSNTPPDVPLGQHSQSYTAGSGQQYTSPPRVQQPYPQGQTPVQGQIPTQNPGQMQGQMPLQGQGQMPAQSPGQMPLQGQGQMPAQSPGQMPLQGQGQMPVLSPGEMQGQMPIQGQGHLPTESPGQMQAQGQGQGPVLGQGQASANRVCVGCEEELATLILMPCEHAVCSDCVGKKKRLKFCPDCGKHVTELIQL